MCKHTPTNLFTVSEGVYDNEALTQSLLQCGAVTLGYNVKLFLKVFFFDFGSARGFSLSKEGFSSPLSLAACFFNLFMLDNEFGASYL